MPDGYDWNGRIMAEFRANGGRVGGNFEGAPSCSCTIKAARAVASTSTR